MASRHDKLLAHALGMPGAWEDHPWGETVAKVGKKVFAFFGGADGGKRWMSVKLPESAEQALMLEHAEPTGYGLGRGGWVSIDIARREPPIDVLRDWIEESYRAIAPKKLSAELDARYS